LLAPRLLALLLLLELLLVLPELLPLRVLRARELLAELLFPLELFVRAPVARDRVFAWAIRPSLVRNHRRSRAAGNFVPSGDTQTRSVQNERHGHGVALVLWSVKPLSKRRARGSR
jgi:hypothetical protein